jgi:hypothetical protein
MNDGHSTTAPSGPHEVWLRGNMRVAGVLGTVAMLLDGGALAAVLMAMRGGGESPGWWGVAAVAAGAASGLMLLAWASSRPRLVRQGDSLLVQVSPLTRQEVPIDVIECFFPGSNPLDADGAPTCGEHAAFRVGTLVIRLAERALDYRSGATFAPWATWSDSYIVLDGRWCEPLSPELVKSLSSRLVTVKRAAAAGAGG